MLVNFIKEKRMGEESLNGKMAVFMREILWMDNFRVKENIILQI